jgi:hypothetical protein
MDFHYFGVNPLIRNIYRLHFPVDYNDDVLYLNLKNDVMHNGLPLSIDSHCRKIVKESILM